MAYCITRPPLTLFYSFLLTESLQSILWKEQSQLQIHMWHTILWGCQECFTFDQWCKSMEAWLHFIIQWYIIWEKYKVYAYMTCFSSTVSVMGIPLKVNYYMFSMSTISNCWLLHLYVIISLRRFHFEFTCYDIFSPLNECSYLLLSRQLSLTPILKSWAEVLPCQLWEV